MKKLRENEKDREMHLTRRSAVKIPRLKNAVSNITSFINKNKKA